MTESKIFIPELWEPKLVDNLNKYAEKSDLNNFILKNTNINMSDHIIENVRNSGTNDAVNKSYVDSQISAVNNLINSVNILISFIQNKIPYMTFHKETVSGSDAAVKIIQKSIFDPIFNRLQPENVLLIPRFENTSNEGPLSLTSKVISINNNTLTFNIKIDNKWKQGWDSNVVVYVYIIIVHQKRIVSEVQNDQSNRQLNELDEQDNLINTRASNIAKSYF